MTNPIIVTDQIAESVYEMKAAGRSDRYIASVLGVSYARFKETLKFDQRLVEALEQGAAQDIQEVADALRENAMTGNFGAQKYYLNNRAPDEWREKRDDTPDGGVQIVISTGIGDPSSSPAISATLAPTPTQPTDPPPVTIDNETGSLL